jgi:uncharacterized protein (TIGR02145 family)
MKTKQHSLLLVLLLVAGHFALATPQTLTVSATDATSYQWYYNTDSSTHGAILIPGATQSDYTPTQSGEGPYYYFCVVSNDCSKDTSHISGMHTFCVKPAITTHPVDTARSTPKDSTAFPLLTLEATGMAPLSCQWYKNETNSKIGGTSLSGATGASYTPENTAAGDLYYYCVVSNDCGEDTSAVSGKHSVTVVVRSIGTPETVSTCNETTSISGKITYGDTSNTDININAVTVGSQTWSAHVFVSGCNKIFFNGGGGPGGGGPPFNSDCRKSTDGSGRSYYNYQGDLFSWCAVVRYASSLCPSPWRVPTNTDFSTLDKALGGPGYSHGYSGVIPKYHNNWGGIIGQYCGFDGTLFIDSNEYYWSSEQYDAVQGYSMHLNYLSVEPSVRIQAKQYKMCGFTLRCVR